MDYSKDYNDLPVEDDNVCPECECKLEVEYFWKNDVKGEPTGDYICECKNK